MGAELAVRSSEFEEKVLKSEVPVLIDFWAEWCGPCKMIGPAIEEISNEYAGKAKVFKVDVDTEGELAGKYNIMSIPALMVFKGGQVVEQRVGAMPKQQIAQMIDRHL